MYKFDIICFSSVPWGRVWGRTRYLMCNLARLKGCRVLYINPEIDFVAFLQDPIIFLQRFGLKNVVMALLGKHSSCDPNILVFTPARMIPFSGKFSTFKKFNTKLYAKRLKKIIEKHFINKYILWINRVYSYDSKHDALDLKPISRVFDWDDDWLSFSKYDHQGEGTSRNIEREDATYTEIINNSDVVFAVSEPLLRRASIMHGSTHQIKNATSLCDDAGRKMSTAPSHRAGEVNKAIKIGYVGHICNRINLELVEYVTKMNEQVQFFFYGPIMKSFRAPKSILKNSQIYFPGAIASDELWRYLNSMDLLVIPHYIDDTTDAQDPVKLYDYLAIGKPIVTTKVAGVESFRGLVRITEGPQEFYRAILESLKENDSDLVVSRRRAAEENSWRNRAEKIFEILVPFTTDTK